MANWSKDETMIFLEAYQRESCIWNTKDDNNKDRKKVANAWSRLSNDLNKPVKELKAKKEILMTTFRRYFKKKQDSIRSGASTEDTFQPSWFAYELMESFLLPLYACNYNMNIETEYPTTNATEQKQLTVESTESADGSEYLSDSEYRLKRKRIEIQETKSSAETDRSECETFSELLVHKLMKLEEDDRLILMNKIDNLVFEATMKAKAKRTRKPNISNQILCDVRSSAYQQSSPPRLSPVNYIFHHTSYSPPTASDDLQCTSIIQNTEVKTEI